ncbi:tol-pal system protein YbgF [Methylotetracoccus oryzae]|uniref:tol-pal system protein YbgF n=1 Tax=Methylotetracoccus oryzae TaxID=1919059 RepID=UPI001118B81F|nr:tol-pal system protein YbgF [Methylotetracoccus oryzae]
MRGYLIVVVAGLGLAMQAGALRAAEPYDVYDRAAGYGVDTLERRVEKLEKKLSGQALSGINEQVDRLQSEVQRLRGELEKATNEIARVKKLQKEEFADLEAKLQQFGKAQTDLQTQVQALTPPAPATAPGTVPGDGSAPIPGQPTDPAAAVPGQAPPPGTAPADPAAAQTAAAPPAVAPREAAYQKAFGILKEGRYPEAIRELKAFLTAYPSGEYSDNAQYWLAEAFYVTKDPAAARSAFDTVIKSYPQSSKVADAMLKLGFIDYDIGQYAQARATLSEVMRTYPNSSAAKLAEKRLERMQQEGR